LKWSRPLYFGYGQFDFAAGESLDPVVERSDPDPGDPHRLRTEAFGAVDGRPVGTPPGLSGVVGSPLITSRDFRYAVVVSEDHGTEWTLALWSPRQNRLLKRLGRYPRPRVGEDEAANLRVPAPFFSPALRWLLLPAPDASGRGVELWRLPEAECVGKAPARPPASEPELTIDPAEVHAVRIGSQVFDLASCKTLCDLERRSRELIKSQDIDEKDFVMLINKNLALGTGRDADVWSRSRRVYAWDLTTGKKAILGTTIWMGSHVGQSQFQLHPDGSRLLIHGSIQTAPTTLGVPIPPSPPGGESPTPGSTYRLELWDVLQRRLIRQIDRLVDSGSRLWVWWDRNSFYLPGGPARGPGAGPAGQESDTMVPPSCYSWSDGRELPPPAETLVTYHEPAPQSFASFESFDDFRDNVVWRRGGALWRGRDGLLLQVGWDPERKPLAGSGQIPRGTFFAPYRFLLASERFSRVGFLDRQARVFVLPYATLTGGDRRLWPRHTDVWEIQSGRRLMTLPDSETFATTDPTGTWLAAFHWAGSVLKVYEAATGRVAHRVKLNGLPVGLRGLAWEASRPLLQLHPRGDRILMIHLGVLYLWDAVADCPVRRVDRPVHWESVDCVAQSAASGLAASGGRDGVILLWDREKRRFLRDLVGHAGAITSLAFRPHGARLASASRDGHVILWDAGGKECWTYHVGHERGAEGSLVYEPHYLGYYTLHREGETATSLVFDPSGATLFVGTSAGRLHRLDAETGRAIAVKDVDTTSLQLARSPGGTHLAVASAGGKVRTWDLRGDGGERTWDVGRDVNCLAFIGEDVIATGGQGIVFWEAATGRRLMSQGIDGGPAVALGFDARTSALLVATKSGDVLDLDVGKMNRYLSEMGLGFLPDRGSRTGR
jgi:WD40 repeat protein